ncbi:MAG: DegT/DnrJ/EryC1/StrS family aminotransferase [Candidatus Cyclobacteriaceae bacterium M2_1C_046]
MIPFFDLQRQYQELKQELQKAKDEVFKSGLFISAYQTKAFEENFSKYLNSRYSISCGNGTDALELVLKAWGVGKGDEVLVPAFTWVSDAEAVATIGAKPVFVDIEPDYYCIDPDKIEENITKNTKAIIAVHLFGHPCDMDKIKEIAAANDLLVLEDVAQAHGAEWRGQKAGVLGDAAIFSFYPTKNLGAYGDGGAVVTDDEMLASKIRLLANHGQPERDHHTLAGRNSRMDELQASFLNVKLRYLEKYNDKRRKNAAYYNLNFNDQFVKPKASDNGRHVYHQYVIKCDKRDELKMYLDKKGIGTAVHYPAPIPATIPFFEDNWKEAYPVATEVSKTILSMPVFPELKEKEMDEVVKTVNRFSLNEF